MNKCRVELVMPGHFILLPSLSILLSLQSCISLSFVGIWSQCWRRPALDLSGWGPGVAQAKLV